MDDYFIIYDFTFFFHSILWLTMPVELIIGGIGLASLLSLFQTCNRAYDVFIRSANDIGKDAHLLGVHLEVERRRLQLWGRYLGISQAQGCQLLLRESYET